MKTRHEHNRGRAEGEAERSGRRWGETDQLQFPPRVPIRLKQKRDFPLKKKLVDVATDSLDPFIGRPVTGGAREIPPSFDRTAVVIPADRPLPVNPQPGAPGMGLRIWEWTSRITTKARRSGASRRRDQGNFLGPLRCPRLRPGGGRMSNNLADPGSAPDWRAIEEQCSTWSASRLRQWAASGGAGIRLADSSWTRSLRFLAFDRPPTSPDGSPSSGLLPPGGSGAIARDLVASVERLIQPPDGQTRSRVSGTSRRSTGRSTTTNRYYLLEKECSPRPPGPGWPPRNFVPKVPRDPR